jgi:hypothetical protein
MMDLPNERVVDSKTWLARWAVLSAKGDAKICACITLMQPLVNSAGFPPVSEAVVIAAPTSRSTELVSK